MSCLRRLFWKPNGLKHHVLSTRNISKVVVVGAGQMGSGIAQVSAQSGHQVVVADLSEAILYKSKANIEKGLATVARTQYGNNVADRKRFTQETLGRMSFISNVEEAVQNADLLIEAIVENLTVKQKLFLYLDKVAPKETIFASNTSSMSIADIASVTERKHKFGGLHFFIPVPVMDLLEVVKTSDTSEETFNSLLRFGNGLGKVTVVCKDTPGFVVNRLLLPYVLEAIRLSERGDASINDIDTAMKLGLGYKIGPFALADYVGLDTLKFIVDEFHRKLPDNVIFRPIPLLIKLVEEGKLGMKSGEGFYKYNRNKIPQSIDPTIDWC